jgi:hypothetical protein
VTGDIPAGYELREQVLRYRLAHPRVMVVHDNKPIHQEAALKAAIEPDTRMIPATPGRPENKTVIEGEFGKYEQAAGTLHLNDSSLENLKHIAVSEIIRAYCASGPCRA